MVNEERLDYFDTLRALAIISVVMLHCAAPLLYEFNSLAKIDWHMANIYDSLTRWCVPIFLMISGYLNINSSHKPLVFYKKRFTKIVIPFIFWAIFYYLFSLYLNPNIFLFNELSNVNTYTSFIKQVVFGPVYYHLWFLYAIIVLYLLNPLLKKWLSHISVRSIVVIVISYFVLISINNIVNMKFNIGFNTSGLANSVGYFVYGLLFMGYYILGHLLAKTKKVNMVLLNFVGLVCLIITIVGTYVITANNEGVFNAFFYHYLNFNTVIVSTWVFLFFKEKKLKTNILIKNISKYSFGIYLAHIFIIDLLNKFDFNVMFINSALGIPLFTIIIIVLSYIVVWTLSKIPIVKAIVP